MVSFLLGQQKKVTRPRQRTEALDVHVASSLCGKVRNNCEQHGRDL
ncbi:hypothetical protein GLA29479_889 [Lysobacter antibioticus]|nr:hypothetical protein GLA29479_889 [Lysobacter antibioticus]